MAVILSPNMSLLIPGVGSEPGPDFAFDINSSLSILDQHDHSPGRGIQITPAGLNINADLTMQGNNLTTVNSVIFQSQLSDGTLLALYVAPGTESPTPIKDLWFTDGVGNPIQLTSNGGVNATSASIPGESFAFGTFFWKQGTGSTTPANFDIGSITLRPNVAATTNGVTLNASGVSSAYNMTLLSAPPASTSFLTMDSSGTLGTISTSGQLTSANLSPTANITGSQLSPTANITGSQLSATAGIVPGQLSSPTTWTTAMASNFNITTGSNNIMIISSFVPLTNRPVFYNFGGIIPPSDGGTIAVLGTLSVTFTLMAGTTVINSMSVDAGAAGSPTTFPISALNCFTAGVNVGATHTTQLNVTVNGGTGNCIVTKSQMLAMQI